MLNVVSMLFTTPNPEAREHGEREFWRSRGKEYAEKFFAGARRHIKEPFQAFLMTDDSRLAPAGVTAVPLDSDPGVTVGWWAKLQVFRELYGFSGRTLYSDLDNVISGDLSLLLRMDPSDPIYLDDRINPRCLNAAAMFVLPENLRFLWNIYRSDPAAWRNAYRIWPHASDQAFMSDRLRVAGRAWRMAQDYLPPGYILNSRAELEKGADWSRTALVYGSWDPKPHESSHPFYAEHWRE